MKSPLTNLAALVGGFLAGFYSARHSWPEILSAIAVLILLFVAINWQERRS